MLGNYRQKLPKWSNFVLKVRQFEVFLWGRRFPCPSRIITSFSVDWHRPPPNCHKPFIVLHELKVGLTLESSIKFFTYSMVIEAATWWARPDTSCHLKFESLCCIPDKGGKKCLLKQYGICCAFRLLLDEMLFNTSDHLFVEGREKS